MKNIKRQLKEMADIDQKARTKDPIDWDEVQAIDRDNTQKLKEMIKESGWITISKFGKKAANDAWLIVQHATHDLPFQESCLKLLMELPEGEVSKSNIALLWDRVQLKKGNRQRYGSQLADKGMFLVLRPVENMESLDDLRAEMGLGTIKDYFKKFNKPVFFSEDEYTKAQSNIT